MWDDREEKWLVFVYSGMYKINIETVGIRAKGVTHYKI